MKLESPAELIVHGSLNHGLTVFPDWYSFNVSTLHSSTQDIPGADKQPAARSMETSEGVVIRGAGTLGTTLGMVRGSHCPGPILLGSLHPTTPFLRLRHLTSIDTGSFYACWYQYTWTQPFGVSLQKLQSYFHLTI